MNTPTFLCEPGRVDEPRAAQDYAAVLSQVATERRALIVRRDGADLAAVVPLEQLELLQEILAREEAEKMARELDAARIGKSTPPPQLWFDETDNPFEATEESPP